MWSGGMGVSGMMTQAREPLVEAVKREEGTNTKDDHVDFHLRSTHNVTGYTIHATDGKIGDVEDFIVDDTSWKLDYLVVDTGHWFPGKKVLISPQLVEEIKWDNSEIKINVSEAIVKNSPEYKPGETISDEDHANLKNYYRKLYKDIY
jgi:hypothetical protein